MSIGFRPARLDDAERLLPMIERFYALDGYPFDPAAARAAVVRLIEDASLGGIWLIELDGAAVGYVALTLGYSLEYRGRDAFIDELYLEPGYRGRGIGTATLAFVEAQCRLLDVRALHLEVERENHAAQALYRKWAFQNHDRMMMTKPLSS